MTKPEHDLKRALELLRSKRRYRNVNHAKLARMLECAELNAPESWLGSPADPAALVRRSGAAGRGRPPLLSRVPGRAWWALALVPAGAAAAVIVLLVTGVFDVMRVRTGAAGIVSGDVVVRRGGSERVLRAGDQVFLDDVIIARAGSSTDIRFADLLRMRVLGGSRIAFRAVKLDGRARAFDALVTAGGCVLDVSGLGPGESVAVSTPSSVATVRGTRFGVRISESGMARYEVFDGTVRVRRRLPAEGPADAGTADILERYFTSGAIDVTGGQACVIGTDRVVLRSLSGKPGREVLESLAMPGPVHDAPTMRDDMEALVRSAGENGAPQRGVSKRTLLAGRGEAPAEEGLFLMYVPVLDSVLRIGGGRLKSLRSGEVLWSVPLDGPVYSLPALEAASLYVATGSGVIEKVDLFTGATQWRARVPGSGGGVLRLALDGSGLYCTASGGALVRLDRDGNLLWSAQTGEAITSKPVITKQLVFVSTQKGSLFGFDVSGGSRMVKVSVRGGIVSIAVGKRSVFIAADTGLLYCYDFIDDRMLWEYRLDDVPAGELAFDGDSVYCFGKRGTISRISAGGEPVWCRDIGTPIVKRPSEDASSFYIPSSEALVVVDKGSGEVTWSLMTPQITSSNMALSRGHIYFETLEKRLSSLRK